MALINPSTLYSGGQGIFDTTPYRVAIQKAPIFINETYLIIRFNIFIKRHF